MDQSLFDGMSYNTITLFGFVIILIFAYIIYYIINRFTNTRISYGMVLAIIFLIMIIMALLNYNTF